MIIFHAMRAPHLMTAQERSDLTAKGWLPEVIDSLHQRGFRPCATDYTDARFSGVDPDTTCGFIRQTCTPHLYITIAQGTILEDVLQQIDSAISRSGYKDGHEHLAGDFMRFFTACKNHRPPPDMADITARLKAHQSSINP